MKKCYVISGFYEDGVPVYAGTTVDLKDEVADFHERSGSVDIISHDGAEVFWGNCCGGH